MFKKFLYQTLGLLFVILAIVGVFLPLLPTTPFLLVSAACFAKSSPKLYQALISNPIFGPLIVNWRENRSIPRKAKVIALISMIGMSVLSLMFLEAVYLKVLLICLMFFPMVYVARLPTTLNE